MSDRNDRFLAWLDWSVTWTGLPSMIEGTQHKRHLRWLPLFALAIASAGLLFCLLNPDRSYWIGYALIMIGMSIAMLLPIWGPLRRIGEHADEFERQQRRDSYLVGLATVAVAGLAGISLTVGLLAMQVWSARVAQLELTALALYMMVLFFAVPTLHASWRTQPLNEER
jgi:hypothetical protein